MAGAEREHSSSSRCYESKISFGHGHAWKKCVPPLFEYLQRARLSAGKMIFEKEEEKTTRIKARKRKWGDEGLSVWQEDVGVSNYELLAYTLYT